MRRPSLEAQFRTASRLALVTAAATLIVGCAGAVRLTEPIYTGSTPNQKQILAGQAGQVGPRPVAHSGAVQSQPLPPPQTAAAAGAAPSGAPSTYTPPKPYAARGMPTPVGPVGQRPARAYAATQPAAAAGGRIDPELAPRSLDQQAAQLDRGRGAEGGRYTVQPGDTMWGIARRYNVTVADLAAANNLSVGIVRSGQRLVIPGAGGAGQARVQVASVDPRAGVAAVPTPRGTAGSGVSVESGDRVSPAAVDLRRRQGEDAPRSYSPPTPRTSAAIPESTSVSQSGAGFRWPVRGRVISSFGKKPNGERNDGINLAVPEGTAVKAAESGVVIYAGNELKSYGNLILIKHADGWVSAYAHNSKLLVQRGDEIRRGQIVAESGMSGGVSSPQLHFELRRGANPVDPLEHLSDA